MQGASHISVQVKYQGILSLAQEALPVIGGIVTRLGIEDLNPEFGQLGALLCTLAADTSSHNVSAAGQHVLGTKLEYVLDQIEKWPGYQETKDYPMLKTIVAAKASQASKSIRSTTVSAKLEKDIRSGLKKYVSCSPEYKVLVQEIQGLSTMDESEPADWIEEASSDIVDKAELVPDYPLHVNKVLYRALFPHLSSCFCENGKKHDIRLRLRPQEDKEDEGLLRFEMLFSVPSVTTSNPFSFLWQESKILVPSADPKTGRKKATKRVSFRDSASPEPTSRRPSSRVRSEEIEPGGFCKLLCLRKQKILSFTVDFQMLRKLDGSETPKKKVEPKDSMSLSTILETRSMSRKAKCVLAYTLAKSVWQYYGSGWMNTPWTHDNIHLLDDQRSGAEGPGKGSYSCRPYLVARFHQRHTITPEYCEADSAMHQYPNVLALGILLIEIAKGHSLTPNKNDEPSGVYNNANLNEYFMLAWQSLNENSIGDIDFTTYREAVRRCLDFDLFSECPFIPGEQNPEDGLKERRNVLYRNIVSPLKRLLEGTGWLSDLDAIKQEGTPVVPTMQPSTTQKTLPSLRHNPHHHPSLTDSLKAQLYPLSISDRPVLPAFLGQGGWTPGSWLGELGSIQHRMAQAVKGWKKVTPVRIAILDTGCDLGAAIFNASKHDAHIRHHWRDWVEDDPEPQDDDGHGTRIVSVLLRTVPNAKVYVARIAKGREALHGSGNNIANAIVYAAKEWDVDIVSLSFGFPTEIESIKNAIRQAESIKNDAIVFFAAAANEGANSEEMFPAHLESVISMRGTDSAGAFVPFYDPPAAKINFGRQVFGTLGKDVPYDWPLKDPSKTMSGCSIATPIAAGIAALVMQYAACRTDEFDEIEQKLIKSRRAIVEVFREISVDKGNGRLYVAPWELFRKDEKHRVAVLRIVLGRLPRSE